MELTKREIIHTDAVPDSALYSQGIKIGNTVFLSGIVAFNPMTKKVDSSTIEEQTDQAIWNCSAILEAAGATLADVVRVSVLLKDPADFDRMNAAYSKHFAENPPTRSVAKLGVDLPNILVSVLMTAVLPSDPSKGPDLIDA